MANQLKMALVNAIISLHQQQWSQRRIARALGIDRETVRRHLELAGQGSYPAGSLTLGCDLSKPATNAPPGSAEPPPVANAPLVSEVAAIGQAQDSNAKPSDPDSQCEPYRAVIESKFRQELSAQRIYQDLTAEHGFTGSYYSVRRFVRRLNSSRRLPFRRLESAPGEQGQVYFGAGAPILTAAGKRQKSHVFRITLSHSRKGYKEPLTI